MDRRNALAVLPALRVERTTRGDVVLPRKFIDGMQKYAEYWDGPITALMEPTDRSQTNLDEEVIDPAALPFQLTIGSYSDPHLAHHLAGHSLILGCVSCRQNHLARVCRSVATPLVYVAEYALKTRLQIAWSSASNAAVAIRRHCWELGQERQHREAIGLATGVQCNGHPTYEAYRGISPNAFLFFDTRTMEEMLIREEELETRLAELSRGGPLRLMFSGRLIAIKGGDHLIRVASELRRLGTAFEMTICGGGSQEPQMKAEVARLGLGQHVKFAGVLDFKTDLTPRAKRLADLFVCCHRSGDPSCTYLETMSCGVPVVGYENEAFRGLVQESGAGWATAMDRPVQLAEKIAELARDRRAVVDASRRALAFARLWTFEETFKSRIEHLKSCAVPSLAGQRRGSRLANAAGPQKSLDDQWIGSL